MKQRLVIRFDILYDERIRSKAMKTLASYEGVKSVVFDEDDETKMEVIVEDMDAYGVLNTLKKRNYKAYMESLEEIKHEKKGHHHEKEKEEKKHKKDKNKKGRTDKKKHRHSESESDSDSHSGSGSSSGSSSGSGSSSDSESDSDKKKRGHHQNRSSSGSSSDSDSDKKKRDHHHNRQTYVYRPTYPPQAYPAPAPYDNGYNYRDPANRYPEGYNQEGCSIM